MIVLVSGASGFLGTRLIKRLVSDHRDVVAIARSPIPTVFEGHPNVRWLVKDIAMDGLDASCLPKISSVVHLAGATLGAGKDENKFLCANEQTTVRLLQALADYTESFIFASSQVVYGDACHLGVTEDFPLQSDCSAYACSKLNSENWMRWFQKRYGGQYVALRFSGFIDGGGIVDYMIDKALAEEPIELFSQGKVCRDYLPSADAINVLVTTLNQDGMAGFLPVNIGSGQPVSAHELATLICTELHSSSPINLLDTPSPQGNFVFSIDRAKALFDFRPSRLTDAVRLYARSRAREQVY